MNTMTGLEKKAVLDKLAKEEKERVNNMKPQNKHTNTPKISSYWGNDGFEIEIIGQTQEQGTEEQYKKIVKCVNCHDGLVEALELALRYLPTNNPTECGVLDKVKQALKESEA